MKPENILVTKESRDNGEHQYEFKIADLGLSHFTNAFLAKGFVTAESGPPLDEPAVDRRGFRSATSAAI